MSGASYMWSSQGACVHPRPGLLLQLASLVHLIDRCPRDKRGPRGLTSTIGVTCVVGAVGHSTSVAMAWLQCSVAQRSVASSAAWPQCPLINAFSQYVAVRYDLDFGVAVL